jgi:glycosyltransferase involved in cell wall biosynthesis
VNVAAPREAPRGRTKIRIVFVGHVAQLSGGEIALMRLIEALVDVDAHVILAEDGPLVQGLREAGVSVEVLAMRDRTRNLRKDRVRPGGVPITALFDTATYVLRLSRRLRAIRPDLVHTNTLKAGIYGSIAARLARVPVVWHVRDRIAPDYLRRPAVLLVRALIATVPGGVIANSEATRATLWRTRGDTSVVYSLVRDPVSRLPHRGRGPRGDRFCFGIVGRLAPWKGQDVFLKAFARAFGAGQEVAAIIGSAMFGDAEMRYADELQELTASLRIADRVEFRGFRADVWAELDQIDVLVHASVTPEPFGQVIVEAMLAGVPVIATAGGGPSEIVTDGVDGLLYPAGDVDALVAAMRRLRHDPALRASLVDSARIRAAQFSPQAAASSVMALYEQVLAASSRERRRTLRLRRHS